MDVLANGDVTLSYWHTRQPDQPAYQTTLFTYERLASPTAQASPPNFQDSTVRVVIDSSFRMRAFRQKLYGQNYRSVWISPVELSVFDIGQEHGGLKVVHRGGGGQTLSLRLEAANGRQYVLRSVRKFLI